MTWRLQRVIDVDMVRHEVLPVQATVMVVREVLPVQATVMVVREVLPVQATVRVVREVLPVEDLLSPHSPQGQVDLHHVQVVEHVVSAPIALANAE